MTSHSNAPLSPTCWLVTDRRGRSIVRLCENANDQPIHDAAFWDRHYPEDAPHTTAPLYASPYSLPSREAIAKVLCFNDCVRISDDVDSEWAKVGDNYKETCLEQADAILSLLSSGSSPDSRTP